MNIGVKISSENLMGQTVDVTFSPLTGGTPIHLGVQTIPFNYYNTYPYGDYAISSTTYDYVYTLTISEPYGQNQNYGQLGNISGETTYSLGLLNFNDFSSQIIELGFDSNYWNVNSWYPMSESGYMFNFSNYGDNARLAVFMNEDGVIVEQYSAITTNYNYDVLDGRISTFIDNTNGVMKFFNGISVYEFTYDPITESANIQWDWNATTLDGCFIFTITNSTNNTKYSFIANSNGSINSIDSWDTTIQSRYYGTYYSSNYFYELNYLNSDSTIISIKIYNTSGDVVFNPSILPNTYTSWNFSWYGKQSFNGLLYNGSNDTIDYYIVNFDGVTQNTETMSHVRGVNYQNNNIIGEDQYWPNIIETGGIYIFLYSNTSTYVSGGGYDMGYLDIIYRLENQTTLQTYTFNDTGVNDKTFYFNYNGGKNYYTFCTTGDSISSIFSITENGVKIVQTNQVINNINGTDFSSFGNYFNYVIRTEGYDVGDFYLCLNGEIVDTMTLDGLNSYYSYIDDYQTYYITNNISSYYVNNQVTGYTETDYFNDFNNSTSYYTQQYYQRNGDFVLFNDTTLTCRVITPNNISNLFSLPMYNGNYDIRVGRDRFLYVYNDNSNNTRINLYNFNGALLNSSLVNINGWNSTYAVKDRYVVKQNDNDGQIRLTMISDGGVNELTIDNEIASWYNINDYIWWD